MLLKSTFLEDFKEKKKHFFEYANFMQINSPTGEVVFKIKIVPSPQRSLQILFSTNFFRNGRKMMLRK